jgi:alpha-tubulin suppressor-like RCC1 family protein
MSQYLEVITPLPKSDGTVWSWGNGYGVGDGTTTTSVTPVQVSGLDVTAVSAGGFHSLASNQTGLYGLGDTPTVS